MLTFYASRYIDREMIGLDNKTNGADNDVFEKIMDVTTASTSSSSGEYSISRDKTLPTGTLTASKPSLALAMLAGLLSVIVGVFSTASNFMYILEADITTDTNYDRLLSTSGMLFCEIALAISFLALAGFFINNLDVREKTPMLIRFAGVVRILLLLILLAAFWKKGYGGWYFILDPNGSNPERIFIVLLGFLQGIFFFRGE